jgi:hypothetical protein
MVWGVFRLDFVGAKMYPYNMNEDMPKYYNLTAGSELDCMARKHGFEPDLYGWYVIRDNGLKDVWDAWVKCRALQKEVKIRWPKADWIICIISYDLYIMVFPEEE